MTDNEIIKALECPASEVDVLCAECPYRTHNGLTCHSALAKDAIDLINRQKAELQKAKAELKETTEKFNCQQYVYADLSDIIKDKNAEIEKLQTDYSSMQSTLAKMSMGVAEAKAEAIKEFAERLKPMLGFGRYTSYEDIDNLVKEMVGESNV